MFKRYIPCMLSFTAALSVGLVSFAQDAPNATQQPATLSANQLMDDELSTQEKAEPIKIDPAILAVPEDANAEQLFEFIEALQGKLPQPQSQEDLYAVVDAFSQTCMKVADKLLAMNDLTPEQKERAIQLKVVALTTRANVDKEAAGELDKFVEDNLKNAKTDEELIKAYQLKLQVLAASEENPIEKINALADEAFQREQEELQLFAIEVKANAFLTSVQKSGQFDKGIIEFVESVINDNTRSTKVKEKAYEMKLVALIIASELEKEKAESERDKSFAEQAEALFTQLLDGDYSLALKKNTYQLRVQTLMEAEEPDQAKIDEIVDKLSKEEDSELYALGVAVKGQTLLIAAQKDKANLAALTEYADKIVEEAKTRPELKTQSIGLKIQSYRLNGDDDALLSYVDQEIANNPADDLKLNLYLVKIKLITSAVAQNPESFDSFQKFIEEVKGNEELTDSVAQIYGARFSGKVSKIAENGGSLEDFNKSLDQFKTDLSVAPRAVTALLMARQAIDKIGTANNNANLFDEVFDSIIDYCKKSDVEELNTLAQNLETYLAQMRQAKEQAEKAAAEKAEAEKAETSKADTEKTESKKATSVKANNKKTEKSGEKNAKTAEKTTVKQTKPEKAKPVAKKDVKKTTTKTPQK